MKSRSMMLCTTVFSLFVATSLQAAPITVPTGLNPGDQYRLAFVTSGTRDATSEDIADYNDFVQAHADAVPELLSLGATWKAVGGTRTISAAQNTGTELPDIGVPIYLLNDRRLAGNNEQFWAWLISEMDRPLNINETGVPTAADLVFTGSFARGQIDSFSPLGGGQLGNAVVGVTYRYDSRWHRDNSFFQSIDGTLPFYGLSEVLTIIPEPSSFLLLSMGLIVLTKGRTRRQQR
jgi:hypothetical protein